VIERRAITDREEWLGWRASYTNASESPALMGDGVHPWLTALKLWAIRSGKIPEDGDSETKKRGRYLEPVAIEMLRDERPDWDIVPGTIWCYDPEARIAATPDVYAIRPDRPGRGVVQIKTVGKFAYRKGWRDGDTGEDEIPLHVAVQVNQEAHLAEADWAAVLAIGLGDGGLDFHLFDAPLKPLLIDKIKENARDFWRRVAENDPYPPDWKRDVATVLSLYEDDDASIIDLPPEDEIVPLLTVRNTYKAIERQAEDAAKARRIVDAQIVARLGNARGARLYDGALITKRTVHVKEKLVKAYSYPLLRVTGDVPASAQI
jgi:YqaJ-like viral recombinase domain